MSWIRVNYTLEVITNADTVRKAVTERNNKTYSILNSSFINNIMDVLLCFLCYNAIIMLSKVYKNHYRDEIYNYSANMIPLHRKIWRSGREKGVWIDEKISY